MPELFCPQASFLNPQMPQIDGHVVMQGKSLGVLVFPALAAGKP
jgi:hypothetical protein